MDNSLLNNWTAQFDELIKGKFYLVPDNYLLVRKAVSSEIEF